MGKNNDRYICANCGYIYDPAAGDSMNAIPPQTSFEELPDEWVCPMCYATQDQFDLLD
ncbi:MAG: rubredoxin [Desulfobulbus sp.]|nr:rubredoxin [Desulfobulbus sp.]